MDFYTVFAFLPVVAALALMYSPFYFAIGPFPVPRGTLIAAIVAFVVWKVSFVQIAAGALQGLFLCFEVIFLLFSSILFVQIIKQSGVLASMGRQFSSFTPDRRMQMILIAWLMGSGLEGLLGFSATGAACALLMMGIGFPPACAVLTAVMGPVTASAFSSMGTPITLGVQGGLQDPVWLHQLALQGVSLDQYLKFVSAKVGIFHGIAGTLMPAMMILTMTRFFGRNRSWRDGVDLIPFALFCGLAFTIPFMLTAIYLGPEFPAVIGAAVGGVLAVFALKQKFLIPKSSWDFEPRKDWPKNWSAGKLKETSSLQMPPWKAWLPFILLGVFMVVTRIPSLQIENFLKSHSFEWANVFGSEVNIRSQFLYIPGIFFIAVSLICIAIYRLPYGKVTKALSSWTVPITFQTLSFAPYMMMMAGIYLNTGINHADLPSMAQVVANAIAQLPKSAFWGPFAAPFLGAISAFYSGNNIFGNMTLSHFQFNLGQNLLTAGGPLFTALHVVGASACNLISIHFLSGTCEAVGMGGWESPMGRKTAFPMICYLTIVGLLGVLSVYNFF